MTERSDLMSWSLFELSACDQSALTVLASRSILQRLTEKDIDNVRRDLEAGTKSAFSMRKAQDSSYHGLCVFGPESPSPTGDTAISIFALAFDTYSPEEEQGHSLSGDSEEPISHETIAASIFAKLRHLCCVNGFERVHCYAPDTPRYLASLCKEGFCFESVYKGEETVVYGMSQNLPSGYTDDPYDGRQLLEWVAKKLRLTLKSATATKLECSLTLRALNPDLGRLTRGSHALPVWLTLDRQDSTVHDSTTLRIRFGTDGGSESVVLSSSDLRELTRAPRLNMSFWPPPSDGMSIAVHIRREIFEKFRANRQNAYFDSGSYGNLLKYALDNNLRPYIFFLDFGTLSTNPRLIGLARVVSVHQGFPGDLWDRYRDLSSWSDYESFRRYCAVKRNMTAVVFQDLKPLDSLYAELPAVNRSWAYVSASQARRVIQDLLGER